MSLTTRRKLLYALLASFASFCPTRGKYLSLVEWTSRDACLLACVDWRAPLGPCNPNVWESPGQGHLWGNHRDYLLIPAATATPSTVCSRLPFTPHLSLRSPGTLFTGHFRDSIHSNASVRKLAALAFRVSQISSSFNASKTVPAFGPTNGFKAYTVLPWDFEWKGEVFTFI